MIFTLVHGIIITLIIIVFILYSVLTSNKIVASYVQLGDIQRREEVHKEIVAARSQNLSAGPETSSPSPSTATSSSATTNEKKDVPMIERISFTIGVVNACLTCYVLGAVPTQYYLWYTPKAIVLITMRWLDFRAKKQHYLLYDFCYWANGATLLYLWVLPKNSTLFQIIFLCANGPLAWSILAFNQSIVFHKWQQVVSVFIHVSPMLLTYGLRWYPSDFNVCDDEFPSCESVTVTTLLSNALFRFYLWWIILYYIWIFVFLGPYIQSRSFKTLYDRVAGNQMKFLLGEGSALASSHHLLKKAVYMLCHVLFGCFTMIIACLWWRYWWAHLSFIITISTCSCYNASKHYDDQFRSDRLIEMATTNMSNNTPSPSPVTAASATSTKTTATTTTSTTTAAATTTTRKKD